MCCSSTGATITSFNRSSIRSRPRVCRPATSRRPIRWILRHQRNVEVWLAEVDVDRHGGAHLSLLTDGEVAYDYLILAPGAAHAYFGHDEWRATAPGLKTLEDALDIRRRVLQAFERAERETDHRRASDGS